MLSRTAITGKIGSTENKTTSKTSSLKALLLKAWRERWSDLQWGINIKTVLPRGVSGDVYDLADCILQQAVIGNGANQLVLSYLKHSLSSQLVSYPAVLQQISKCGMKQLNKPHCVISLLDFLESIQNGITCRAKPEETLLPSAILNICFWLLNVVHYNLTNNQTDAFINQNDLIEKPTILLNNFLKDSFFLSMLYLAKFDNLDVYTDTQTKCTEIESLLTTKSLDNTDLSQKIENTLKILNGLELDLIFPSREKPESVTYCVQSLLTIHVFTNPCIEIKNISSQLLMVKRIKGYSMKRLYCELIRACFLLLVYISETSEESQWGGFTFLTLPQILQYLHNLTKSSDNYKTEYSQDIVDAFEMLLQYTPLLDCMDVKCSCNSLECLLNELLKFNLVTEKHCKAFSIKREGILQNLQKIDPSTALRASIPKIIVISAEPTLAGILKTLDSDYVKTQEALLSMLHQVLTGKSFELILAIATVEGKLKTFVSKLIKFNEHSKQPLSVPESPKNAQSRAMLFDISFLMLCRIVQTYGSKNVLEENGDSFFEKWTKICMVERDVPKSPDNILKLCEQPKVDALLKQFLSQNDNTNDFKINQKWHEVCMNISGVVKEILYAWERDTIGAVEVKRVLDALRGCAPTKTSVPSPMTGWTAGLCSLAVCASAWLCAHIRLVHHDAILKPMNMVQQLGTSSPSDMPASSVSNSSSDEANQESFKEKSILMSIIIRKFQYYDINPPSSLKNKQVSNQTTKVQFQNVFEEICSQGSITNTKVCTVLENLLHVSGSRWFVYCVVQEVLKLKYVEDLNRACDLAFAIFHLNIEECTIMLLTQVLPVFLFNILRCEIFVEPQCFTLAKLCIYCIVATIELHNPECGIINLSNSKRPRRDVDSDEEDNSPASKLLRMQSNEKVNQSNVTTNKSDQTKTELNNSKLFTSKGRYQQTSRVGATVMLKSNLQQALTNLFRDFSNILTRETCMMRQVYFIYDFLKVTVLYAHSDLATVILKSMPSNLIPNLLKCMPHNAFTYDMLLKLYDLSAHGTFLCNSQRDLVARDMCLLRNISLKKENILLRRQY